MAAFSPSGSGMDSTEGDSVMEGFLCPMCLQDLQSFHNLQSHFESEHSNEDKAVMSQIRGLFSKAKDKLLGREYEEDDDRNPFSNFQSSSSNRSLSFVDPAFWEPQELGVTKSHIDKFKSMRDARIDRVVIETNKIVIRLEKLLKPVRFNGKRNHKAFEQSLVPWVQDEDVPFCPTCGDKFNVARRKHHCRLCGAIMCTKCSIFLPFLVAEELIKQINNTNIQSPTRAYRNNLQQSVNNIPDEEIEKIFVRICYECDKVLQRNKERLDRRFNPSLLVTLHKKMQTAMESAVNSSPEFQKMAESLNNGEEEYKLDAATEKRLRLMQMFEAVDVISKKIAALDTQDEDDPPTQGELKLQTSIRRAACGFLQEYMLILPSLPSQPKLTVLQAQRRAENERRLRQQRIEAQRLRDEEKRKQEVERLQKERDELERARKEEQMQQMNDTVAYSTFSNSNNRPNVLIVKDSGWSADAISIASNSSKHSKLLNYTSDDEEDLGRNGSAAESNADDPLNPLLEQIEYVKESAKQARAAGMEAEAESLERNMEELKTEYRRQQTARAFAVVTPSTPPEGNPFEVASMSSQNSFNLSSRRNDTGEDPLLQQIQYITQCVDEATFAERYDEARILSENLQELKDIYNRSKS
uniref:rabenosyn-5-like isoform X1 n=1 Tax=Styela clava TaxID=7725 RepID=UPI0019394A73|nr:rabenosyn-5-like isoform X1 [Styela clava]